MLLTIEQEILLNAMDKAGLLPGGPAAQDKLYVSKLTPEQVEEQTVKVQRDSKKITNIDIISALKVYDRTPQLNKHLRVGQHLCNTFKITDSKVFYNTDNKAALAEFRRKYQV